MEPTVDAFWRWSKPVDIGGRTIWMRTLSASDDGERTRAAMSAARRLRMKLVTEGSSEREELLMAYQAASREEMVATVRAYQTEMSQALSYREVQPKKDPPEPTGPTLDDVMDAEDQWQAELQDVAQRRGDWVKEQVEKLVSLHVEKPDDELRETVIDMQISAFCTEEFNLEHRFQTVYRSCYEDKKFTRKTFSSIAAVKDMDGRVFDRLATEYFDLDQFSLKADALKN